MTDQKTINDVVWRACDTFRGTIDASNYKDYILVMLFVKYLTDLRKEKLTEYEGRYGGDTERVARAMPASVSCCRRKPISIISMHSASNRTSANASQGPGHHRRCEPGQARGRISQRRFQQRGQPGGDQRAQCAPGAPTRGLPRRTAGLEALAIGGARRHRRRLRIPHREFASDAGKKGGEFYTPAEVSRLLATIVAPKSGDRICDPCCGSGSLLIRAGRAVGADDFALYGQELNGAPGPSLG